MADDSTNQSGSVESQPVEATEAVEQPSKRVGLNDFLNDLKSQGGSGENQYLAIMDSFNRANKIRRSNSLHPVYLENISVQSLSDDEMGMADSSGIILDRAIMESQNEKVLRYIMVELILHEAGHYIDKIDDEGLNRAATFALFGGDMQRADGYAEDVDEFREVAKHVRGANGNERKGILILAKLFATQESEMARVFMEAEVTRNDDDPIELNDKEGEIFRKAEDKFLRLMRSIGKTEVDEGMKDARAKIAHSVTPKRKEEVEGKKGEGGDGLFPRASGSDLEG